MRRGVERVGLGSNVPLVGLHIFVVALEASAMRMNPECPTKCVGTGRDEAGVLVAVRRQLTQFSLTAKENFLQHLIGNQSAFCNSFSHLPLL